MSATTVRLRSWAIEDAGELVRLANDRRIAINMSDGFPHPYGPADADRFLTLATTLSPPTYFAIEVEGRLAGGIGYLLHAGIERVRAEVGYWVGVEFWGRGVGTAALRLLTDRAFEAHPELRRLYAVPFSWNPASARILEKCGYKLESTMRQSAIKEGRVVDQWMYVILREEWEIHRADRAACEQSG